MSGFPPTVNGNFDYPASVLDALENSLSPERLGPYLRRGGEDRAMAIRLYCWNTAISAAFYGPLQSLEVALRNAIHREMRSRYGDAWYDEPSVELDVGALGRLSSARQDLLRGCYPDDPPHMVAALSFGFWVALLGSGGRLPTGGKANDEMTIWRAAAYRAFPHVRASRKRLHGPLDYLRSFRNRIAHHEPIVGRHLAADHQSLLEIAGWICPHTRDWIRHHSRVPMLLAMSPDDTSLRF